MGSGSSSAGNAEHASLQGRHRRAGELSAWTTASGPVGGRHTLPAVGPYGQVDVSHPVIPAATLLAATLPATPAPPGPEVPTGQGNPDLGGRPAPDPLVDSGSVGLRMFNLGTIPASVTPPRSWRRAAWFTVLASAGALVGLLVIGSMLVGPVRGANQFDAMPNFPSGSPLATIPGRTSQAKPGLHTAKSTDSAITTSGADRIADVGDTAPLPAGPRHGGSGSGGSGSPSRPGGGAPVSSRAPVVPTLPVVTTMPSDGEPVVDPAKLIKRTQTFFAEVTSNAKAAADLTSDTIHDDAVAVIHQKYGNVSSIQVRSISLDPTSGLTISVLRVTKKDGSASTARTTLQFTLTGDPKIENPGG